MERLTDIINGWTFEETIKTAESLMEAEKNMFKWDVLRHLKDFAENYRERIKEYQQLEEQGRLVKLPCKVGDDVYKSTVYVNVVMAQYNYHIYYYADNEDRVTADSAALWLYGDGVNGTLHDFTDTTEIDGYTWLTYTWTTSLDNISIIAKNPGSECCDSIPPPAPGRGRPGSPPEGSPPRAAAPLTPAGPVPPAGCWRPPPSGGIPA